MQILAIDPGTTRSAWLYYDTEKKKPLSFDIFENEKLVEAIKGPDPIADHLAIEMVACYGMAVGKAVFETCVWIGRFIEAFGSKNHTKVYRMDVKMCLCKNSRAKDGNIRQAAIDRFEPTGGGACPQVGIKSQPGPLYGVSKDIWSALAVAITWVEVYGAKNGRKD